MTDSFPSETDSLSAARAAARAAAATAAAAASAAAAAAAADQDASNDMLRVDTDRLDIDTAKHTVMDDPMVTVDPDSVVAATPDPHSHHSEVDHRKSHHNHDDPDTDAAAVANGEPESESIPLHVVVPSHDPSADDRREPSDHRVVDAVPDLPVSVAPHLNHQNSLQDAHHDLDARVDDVPITTTAAQETDTHSHIAELLPAPVSAPLAPHPPIMQTLQPPTKKKRKTYNTEEERRQARILKNRRTAEESRQRRMKRMKELEEYAVRAAAQEKELQEELRINKERFQEVTDSLRDTVEEKNAEIARKDAEIRRLQEKLAIK